MSIFDYYAIPRKRLLQIHKKGSRPLASVLRIELIKEIIKVRLVLLPDFIMENLKSFSMLWLL